jgi:hypothetical protein
MKYIPLVLTFFVMIGCDNNRPVDSKLYFSNNFESAIGWVDNKSKNMIWKDGAFSGHVICQIDSVAPYTPTFNMQFKDISDKPIKSVKIDAQIMMSGNESNPTIVVDIRNQNFETIEWIPSGAKHSVNEMNKWVPVTVTVNLQEKDRNNPENFVRIYVSNVEPKIAFVDDIQITFEE